MADPGLWFATNACLSEIASEKFQYLSENNHKNFDCETVKINFLCNDTALFWSQLMNQL